jgi:hypothetical protein
MELPKETAGCVIWGAHVRQVERVVFNTLAKKCGSAA